MRKYLQQTAWYRPLIEIVATQVEYDSIMSVCLYNTSCYNSMQTAGELNGCGAKSSACNVFAVLSTYSASEETGCVLNRIF